MNSYLWIVRDLIWWSVCFDKCVSLTFYQFVSSKVLISINHVVQSAPQFSQSFSSSSVLKPNGEVVSNSIYTDSQGNEIVNGNKNPPKPILFNFLLPPLGVPYEPVGPQTPPPVFKPVPYQFRKTTQATTTQRTTAKLIITTTKRPTVPSTKKPLPVTAKKTVKASLATKPSITKRTTVKIPYVARTTIKPIARSTVKPIIRNTVKPQRQANRPKTNAFINRTSGAYVQDSSGVYRADNRGTYKPDERGKYNPTLYNTGEYRRN